MLRIRRIVTRGGQKELRHSRGPLLTEHAEEGRGLTIELFGTFMVVRLAGQRRRLPITYASIWTRACLQAARVAAEEKQRLRKQRRQLKSAALA